MKHTKQPPKITQEKGKVLYITQKGFGRIIDNDGKEIDLPYCLPGETVIYDKVERKRHTDYYYRGIAIKSLNRVEPICPHFSKCGGCALQHMNEKDYKEFKKSIVIQYLQTHGLDPFAVEDPIILKAGQRRRTNIDIRKKNDRIFLGYHQLKSHAVMNVGPCPVLDPKIEELLEPFAQCLNSVLENFQKAKIFITNTDTGIDLSFEIQEVKELTENQRLHLKKFSEDHDLCRFMFKYRKTQDIVHEREKPYVFIDGIKVDIEPWSFLQSSIKADEQLTKWVIDAVPEKAEHIYDLFCGRGTFTFPLSRQAAVTGIELDQHALNALNKANDNLGNKRRNIITNQQNLFDTPVKAQQLNKADVVVIDPPRAGASAQCIEIGKSNVKTIIYVSCNPETFAKDCAVLRDAGYRLNKVHILDQFIYTPHLEVVGVLTLIRG
jgi:23S rRNA (uracil1939-C5)-methyltransferase